MSDPVTIGAFTFGAARLSEHGDLALDANGAPTDLTDIYTVILGFGVRATSANVTGLPAVNAAHVSVPTLYVSGYRFSCINTGSGIWNVSVDYSKSETTTIQEEEEEDFVSKVTAKSWDTAESTIDLVTDAVTGESIINSAGDPFDSVPQRTILAPKVIFSRTESRAPSSIIALNGSINQSQVTVLGVTFPAFCARLRVTCKDTMAAEGARYAYDYEIEGRINFVTSGGVTANIGWRDAFIQSGYNFIKDGKRYKFTEKTKNPQGEEEEKEVSSPQLLTVDGGDGRGSTPVVKLVSSYKPQSWSVLKLPS